MPWCEFNLYIMPVLFIHVLPKPGEHTIESSGTALQPPFSPNCFCRRGLLFFPLPSLRSGVEMEGFWSPGALECDRKAPAVPLRRTMTL